MKYFNKSWDSFCKELLGEGKTEHRKKVLMKVMYTSNVVLVKLEHLINLDTIWAPNDVTSPHLQVEEHQDLQLLLSVTDLLASCAEGENLFVESTCQTIYKVLCSADTYRFVQSKSIQCYEF